jgi:riboflavin kinase/FMN adenylyltransferase
MRILRGLPSSRSEVAPSVAALGSFDGIHLAHVAVLQTTVERARTLGASAVACTFDPHPSLVLHPDRAPAPIATLEDNLDRIAAAGIDATLVIPFTPEFSQMEAEAFVERVLITALGVREIVVGFNHTFGRGARGTAGLLAELGAKHDFVARVLPPLQAAGQTVSSSAIRDALREGDVATARRFLGHPYSIKGPVMRGAGRGRTLGFPTANLRPDRPLILAAGVYVCRASWDAGAAWGVVNVGYRPTFEEQQYWVEAFLLDWSGDLYDRVVRVEFLQRIRGETKFPSVEALTRQVMADIDAGRRMVQGRSPVAPDAGELYTPGPP